MPEEIFGMAFCLQYLLAWQVMSSSGCSMDVEKNACSLRMLLYSFLAYFLMYSG